MAATHVEREDGTGTPAAGTAAPPPLPVPVPELSADSPGAHLPDDLVDGLDRTIRRLRRSMIKPPAMLVPVPSLGRQVDIAKIFACDAVEELSSSGGSVTVKDVASSLDLEHSTVSRLLSEAESEGFLTRGTDPDDRRRTTVELTDIGHAVVSDATAMTRFFTRLLLADWDRDDLDQLTRLLGKLADTVSSRMDLLPDLADREFARTHPEIAESVGQMLRDAHRPRR